MALRDVVERLPAGSQLMSAVVIVGVSLLFAGLKLRVATDPREPPLVKPRFPFFGHIFGLMSSKIYYIAQLGTNNPSMPIFTMPVANTKMYILASPQLIHAVYKSKALSFDPLTRHFSERMVGFGPNIVHLLHNPPTDGSVEWLHDQARNYRMLSPGPALYEMNARVLQSLAGVLNSVGAEFETKSLYLWLRDAFTVATTGALFGFNNPVTDNPALLDDLWTFEGGQEQLLLYPFPSITIRKIYYARLRLQQTLRAYFRDGYDAKSDVSQIIKARAATNRKWGLGTDDQGDHELGMLFVAVTNAIPTMFWMIAYIFSDPQLVADLRDELVNLVAESTEAAQEGSRRLTFDISAFATSAPLFNSAYREVMRLSNRQQGNRKVVQDVVFTYNPPDGGASREYLLKKDNDILMPSLVTNFDPGTWGDRPYEFEPRRFLDVPRERESLQNRAANPYGGGKHLCPGRHFAYAEIMGTTAALILGYIIETPDGGKVSVPAMSNNMAEAVAKPWPQDQESLVRIKRRPGWEDVEWCFSSGSSKAGSQ